jgi:hypothetical protein
VSNPHTYRALLNLAAEAQASVTLPSGAVITTLAPELRRVPGGYEVLVGWFVPDEAGEEIAEDGA